MSEFVQREFCERIAAVLGGLEALRECRVVVEDLADVYAAVAKATTGVVAAVSCVGHTRRRGGGSSLSGTLDFEILFAEKPQVNRAGGRRDFLSAQCAAEAASRALHFMDVEGFGRLVYDDMRRQDEDGRAQVFLSLHAEQSLDRSKALSWGLADGTQAYGEIVQRRVVNGGSVVIEPDHRGASRYSGVRDRHIAVDLRANIPAGLEDVPVVGSSFTCPVRGASVTFVCTASDVEEDAEDAATLHLAGRTMPGETP